MLHLIHLAYYRILSKEYNQIVHGQRNEFLHQTYRRNSARTYLNAYNSQRLQNDVLKCRRSVQQSHQDYIYAVNNMAISIYNGENHRYENWVLELRNSVQQSHHLPSLHLVAKYDNQYLLWRKSYIYHELKCNKNTMIVLPTDIIIYYVFYLTKVVYFLYYFGKAISLLFVIVNI